MSRMEELIFNWKQSKPASSGEPSIEDELISEIIRLREALFMVQEAAKHFACEVEPLKYELALANETIKYQKDVIHRYKTGKGWR